MYIQYIHSFSHIMNRFWRCFLIEQEYVEVIPLAWTVTGISSLLASFHLHVFYILFPESFFFLFRATPRGIWKFLGQGLNSSCSCYLRVSCVNAGSFNPLYQAGDRTGASASAPAAAVGFITHYATMETARVIFIKLFILSLPGSNTFCGVFARYIKLCKFVAPGL